MTDSRCQRPHFPFSFPSPLSVLVASSWDSSPTGNSCSGRREGVAAGPSGGDRGHQSSCREFSPGKQALAQLNPAGLFPPRSCFQRGQTPHFRRCGRNFIVKMCGVTSLPPLHPCLFSNFRLLNKNWNLEESLISPKLAFKKCNSLKKFDLFHVCSCTSGGWIWIILKVPSSPDHLQP